MNEHAKTFIDGAAMTTVVASFMAWLPPTAAALSIVWTAIRIYETRTFQGWIKRWKR
jgi:hypothetical protein